MREAVDGWVRQGGGLMHMGVNGFYWRVAYHAAGDGIIEVRRSEDGTRAWDAEVGEYYHSFTGEYGGLWRRQNRAPHAPAGGGVLHPGLSLSPHYRPTHSPAASPGPLFSPRPAGASSLE